MGRWLCCNSGFNFHLLDFHRRVRVISFLILVAFRNIINGSIATGCVIMPITVLPGLFLEPAILISELVYLVPELPEMIPFSPLILLEVPLDLPLPLRHILRPPLLDHQLLFEASLFVLKASELEPQLIGVPIGSAE